MYTKLIKQYNTWYAVLDVDFVSLFLTGPSNILNNTLNMLCLTVIVS